MEKEFEVFILSMFKFACDNLAQKLIEYSNEYNELLSKILNSNSKIVTFKDKKDVEQFYKKMTNDKKLMKDINHIWSTLNDLKEKN